MATIASVPEERSASIGTILSRAFGVMGDNPVVIFGISCLFGAVPPVIFNYFAVSARSAIVNATALGGVSPLTVVALGFGSVLIFLLCGMLAQGAIVRATVAYAHGERASFGESIAVGLRKAIPLIILSILMLLALMTGFMLFLVPGILLALMWAVAAPVLVTEDVGIFGSFGRSRFLTKGARWKIFGLFLLLLVLIWIVSAVLGVALISLGGASLAADMATGQLPVWYMALSLVTNTFTTALWSTILTSLYVGLRNWKDGPQVDTLADVFA